MEPFLTIEHFERLLVKPLFGHIEVQKRLIRSFSSVCFVHHNRFYRMALHSLYVVKLGGNVIGCNLSLLALLAPSFAKLNNLPACLTELIIGILPGWNQWTFVLELSIEVIPMSGPKRFREMKLSRVHSSQVHSLCLRSLRLVYLLDRRATLVVRPFREVDLRHPKAAPLWRSFMLVDHRRLKWVQKSLFGRFLVPLVVVLNVAWQHSLLFELIILQNIHLHLW